MPHWESKRTLAIVSACMNADGTPTFAVNEADVTQDEAENGIHYYLVEADLLEQGFEEPFVHFDPTEAPPFLLPAVRAFLRSHGSASPNQGSPRSEPVAVLPG